MLSPMEFYRQTRAEMRKVTWPDRKETTISTIAVFVMVVIVAIFLFASDQIIALLVRSIIGLGA